MTQKKTANFYKYFLSNMWNVFTVSSFFLFIYLFYFTILYWFCHTLTWICHECTCVPHTEPPRHLPPCTIPPGHPSAPAPTILYRTWTGDSFLIWYYTCFHAIPPNPSPSPSPTESKRLFYTSMILLLSCIQGYHYHLSKFHIYALVYCIGVFLSGLLHSV